MTDLPKPAAEQPAPTADQLRYFELRERFEQWHDGLISDGEYLQFISQEMVRREGLRAMRADAEQLTTLACPECGLLEDHLTWCSRHPCNDREAVKQVAYAIDSECWVSYSGKPREFKRAMDRRRTAALEAAYTRLKLQHGS